MLQSLILILNCLIKNFNVVLLALCAVFGDTEKKKCYQLCEVQSSKNLLLFLSFESRRNLLLAQVLRVAGLCSLLWSSKSSKNLLLDLMF